MQKKCHQPWVRLTALALSTIAPASDAKQAARLPGTPVAAKDAARSNPGGWQPVVTGQLPNGLRYAILPRRSNEPGVGLLMRNEGGFIAERRPGERGLAHLIEHLFFVSPTETAPDDLGHFVHVGLPLTFPAPSAGTTSWRETNLFVSTKTSRGRDLNTLLGLFRETATALTFRADAVDGQRADVQREMGEKKPSNDIHAGYIAAVAPGSPNDVIDAQNSDDVPVASIETIRGLYHRLYQPENMMIVVVGPVDPAQTRALIEKRFGSWQHAGPPIPRSATPVFQPDRIRPISISSLQQSRRIAMVTVVSPTPATPPSRTEQARAMLMDMLTTRAINDRLALGQPGAAAGQTGIFIENGEPGHRMIIMWDNFATDKWAPAVARLKATTCDLRTVGFTEIEWDAARHNVARELEQRARDIATVPNVELAKDLSHALAADRALIPPDELLREARAIFPTIDAPAASDWWLRQWSGGIEHLRVEAPELLSIPNALSAIRATADGAVDAVACKVRQ